jgi:putative protein kinase ArgK-like GTPase of G3E family
MFSLDYWYYFDPQNWLIIESRNGSKYLINETGLDCFILLRNNAKHIDTLEELRSFIAANKQKNGIEELVNEIKRHIDYLKDSGKLEERRKKNMKLEVTELIEYELRKIVISNTTSENRLESEVNKIINKEKNMYEVRDEFLKTIREE